MKDAKTDTRLFFLIGISIVISLITSPLIFLDLSLIGEIGSNTLLSLYAVGITRAFGMSLMAFFLHYFVPVAFIILFYFFVKAFFQNENAALVSGLVFVLSPIYIRLFSSINVYFLPLMLLMLGVLLLEKKRFYWGVPILALSAVNYAFMLIALLSLAYYSFKKKDKIGYAYSALIFGSFLYISFFIFSFDFSSYFYPALNLSDLLFEFSNNLSITSAVFLFSVLGVFLLGYKRKPEVRHLLLVLFAFISAGFSLASKYQIVLLLVFMLPFSGLALSQFFSYKWKRKNLQVLSIIIITYLLVLPTVVSISRLNERVEDNREIYELASLKGINSSFVFAPLSYNCIIAEIHQQKTLFTNPLCSDFYMQDYELARTGLKNRNKTGFFISEEGLAYWDEVQAHSEFYEIYNVAGFRRYASEKNLSLIVIGVAELSRLKDSNENLFQILDKLNKVEATESILVLDAKNLTSFLP